MMRWIQNTVCFSGLFKSCPACDMADNRQEVMWLLKHVLHRGGDERDSKSEIYSSIYIYTQIYSSINLQCYYVFVSVFLSN